MDKPLDGNGPSGQDNIMGIPKSKLGCSTCGDDATRFAIIKRKWNHMQDESKVIQVTIGFYCDECSGDVDELAIAGAEYNAALMGNAE